jgi:hypothetical protein
LIICDSLFFRVSICLLLSSFISWTIFFISHLSVYILIELI